ncbi:MAG: hypothetical protein BWY91_01815 [bacterium ADurb.BinA028]|nr:MAG: hypothetical protein BWY91_01815 [bacterium ADurb.BinA028]
MCRGPRTSRTTGRCVATTRPCRRSRAWSWSSTSSPASRPSCPTSSPGSSPSPNAADHWGSTSSSPPSAPAASCRRTSGPTPTCGSPCGSPTRARAATSSTHRRPGGSSPRPPGAATPGSVRRASCPSRPAESAGGDPTPRVRPAPSRRRSHGGFRGHAPAYRRRVGPPRRPATPTKGRPTCRSSSPPSVGPSTTWVCRPSTVRGCPPCPGSSPSTNSVRGWWRGIRPPRPIPSPSVGRWKTGLRIRPRCRRPSPWGRRDIFSSSAGPAQDDPPRCARWSARWPRRWRPETCTSTAWTAATVPCCPSPCWPTRGRSCAEPRWSAPAG